MREPDARLECGVVVDAHRDHQGAARAPRAGGGREPGQYLLRPQGDRVAWSVRRRSQCAEAGGGFNARGGTVAPFDSASTATAADTAALRANLQTLVDRAYGPNPNSLVPGVSPI